MIHAYRYASPNKVSCSDLSPGPAKLRGALVVQRNTNVDDNHDDGDDDDNDDDGDDDDIDDDGDGDDG